MTNDRADEQILEGYPVVIDVPLAWGDMDAMGHANNTVYFRWFESARIAYFERSGFLELMERTGVGPILASTSCRFRVPLTYPDRVSVGARIARLGDDRFVMEYAVVSGTHRRLAADGEGLVVAYDYRAKVKSPIPDELVRRIQGLESKKIDSL